MWKVLPCCLLAFAVGCGNETGEQADADGTTPTTPVIFAADETVEMNVPEMHCPVSCYPKVKETLESQPGVASVELAEQEKEGTIDNPTVLITLDEEFDAAAAEAALAEAGFKNNSSKKAESAPVAN